jgi:hypothetical protein
MNEHDDWLDEPCELILPLDDHYKFTIHIAPLDEPSDGPASCRLTL